MKNIVVGAGVAGCTIARLLAEEDEKVLVIEKRDHIGGQAHDFYDINGILIHKYGPHIFHTNSKKVFNFLSKYTDWHIYNHEVLAFVDNHYIPVPFNINSIKKIFPEYLSKIYIKKLVDNFGYNTKITIWDLKKSKDKRLNELGVYIYNKIFKNYTKKQWALSPEELKKEVTSRVPVNISKDNRYFFDKYQVMPDKGYTYMFNNMLNHKNIELLLNTDYKSVIRKNGNDEFFFKNQKVKKLFYTGPVDYFFDFKFGQLPYRSLKFKFVNFNREYYQNKGVINYPNNYDFTRITEFKHLTEQKNVFTTIVKEYPSSCDIKRGDIPYYPIPRKRNEKKYNRYLNIIKNLDNVYFIGRLAEYKYYNMTSIIEKILKMFG